MRQAPGKIYHGAVGVGVGRRPGLVSVGDDDHRGIAHRVARRHAAFHGQGVDERLYGGAHLAAALPDVVVFEVAVVRTAHVGLYMSGTRFNGHEGRPEEGLVVADGVVRCHEGISISRLVPGEDPHLYRFREAFFNFGIGMAGGLHHACTVAPAAGLLKGGFNHLLVRIGREGSVLAVFEFPEEGLLQVLAQMFGDGFLGIALHLIIDGGVDAQAVPVQVVLRAVALGVLVQPAVQRVVGPQEGIYPVVFRCGVGRTLGLAGRHGAAQHIPEIGADAGGAVSGAGVQVNGQLLQGVAFGLGKVFHFLHAAENEVAALEGVLRIDGGVIARGLVYHTHQHGAFLREQFRGVFPKELVGGR